MPKGYYELHMGFVEDKVILI